MDKKKRVIISTFYEGHAVKVAISKLSSDKLILLIDEPKNKNVKKKIEDSLKELKKFYLNILEIEIIKIRAYDMHQIIEKVSQIIEKESKMENKILVHISEGRKITSLALLFSAYMNRGKIEGAYYITEEEHKLISLPLINFSLGESKKKLLKEIAKGNGVVHNIEKKLKIKPSAIYQHVHELKQEGYIENNKELKLTDLGRIMIL